MLGLLLWPVPLLGLLQAESSALVAAAAFFTAGLSSISLFRRGHTLLSVLVWQIAALVVPLALLTATLIWRANCAYVQGLMFYTLFAVPTVVFAVGMAFALDKWRIRRRCGWLVVLGLGICILGPVYDIGFHPQFYTYNHVFGGILGPVYDEELAVRPGLFVFRALTLAWAALFISLGRQGEKRSRRGRRAFGDRRYGVVASLIIAATILGAYVNGAELGFNTTVAQLEEALPGHRATEHFDIYYHPDVISDADLQVIADEHEFRYYQLARKLDVEVADRIQSFVYPDAETKGELTGARYTNVAPVWLSSPQSHVLASEFALAFPHELAHVFSRDFGLPILSASLWVGLVEGLAVALEPPDGRPTPHEQASAALLSTTYESGAFSGATEEGARDLAAVVASHLSPMGFWSGRGAVSYTTMGSFVQYLLEGYGADAFKDVYATGDFRNVYGKPLRILTAEWTAALLSLHVVAASSGPMMTARFSVPSLFEKRCPHYVPPYRADYRRALTALVRGDSTGALDAASASLAEQPRYLPSLDLWGRLMLAKGRENVVRMRIEPIAPVSSTAALLVRLGDSRALTGDSSGARTAYDKALERLPAFAHDDASRIYLRLAAAGRPEIVRSFVDGRPPSSGHDPLAAIARSFYHARRQQYELAAEVLRTTRTPVIDSLVGGAAGETLQRRHLVWLAQFHYRSGAHSAASTYAEKAADAYRIAGAFNEAAQLDDFRRMMLWLMSPAVTLRQENTISHAVSK